MSGVGDESGQVPGRRWWPPALGRGSTTVVGVGAAGRAVLAGGRAGAGAVDGGGRSSTAAVPAAAARRL